MGKPKPLPAVAEVPPEALAEDRRRAEAMVALVKEMTKGEDRRERLLRRARPSERAMPSALRSETNHSPRPAGG